MLRQRTQRITSSPAAFRQLGRCNSAQQWSNSQCQHCRIHFCSSSDGCHGWQPPSANRAQPSPFESLYFTLTFWQQLAPHAFCLILWPPCFSTMSADVHLSPWSPVCRRGSDVARRKYRMDAVFERAKQPACTVRHTNFSCAACIVCASEHVCGAFGCWLLQLYWGGQQLESLQLALLPVASHSGAIGSYIWDGAKVRCRRSKLGLARPIGPIPRAAHRTSVRFALSGTSVCVAEHAAGICMSVCMRTVGSGAAADLVCFHRDRQRGLI